MLKIMLPAGGSLLVGAAFRAGRKYPKECRETRRDIDRILSGKRLYRGFGALTAGGLLGIPMAIAGFRRNKKRAAALCAGGGQNDSENSKVQNAAESFSDASGEKDNGGDTWPGSA
jgi:hypothetical protein